MKMKKACEATTLTERAIRLYLTKNLISPRQINGTIDFSDEDIQRLKDIAVLRQYNFSIEQISSMIHNPATISDIVLFRIDNAQATVEHENDVCSILSKLEVNNINSLSTLVSKIREHSHVPPELNFGKYDELNDEFIQRESAEVFEELSKIDRRKQLIKRILSIASFITICAVLCIAFLSYPRLSGYISMAPISIVELGENNTVTVFIKDDSVVDIIGRDKISVPYRAYGVSVENGMVFENGCQLAVELTNLDLIQIGINPLQNFQTSSTDIIKEWRRLIMHSLFETPFSKKATLWIREISNLKPLLGIN